VTGGSNPACSSGESATNHLAGRSSQGGGDLRPVYSVLPRTARWAVARRWSRGSQLRM